MSKSKIADIVAVFIEIAEGVFSAVGYYYIVPNGVLRWFLIGVITTAWAVTIIKRDWKTFWLYEVFSFVGFFGVVMGVIFLLGGPWCWLVIPAILLGMVWYILSMAFDPIVI